MTCLDLMASAGFPGGTPSAVSIVGGGGKTSFMFALASELRALGRSVLVTTTTRIFDPRDEGRIFDALYLDDSWTAPALASSRLPRPGVAADSAGFLGIAGSGTAGGKLLSVDPSIINAAAGWDCILVEADGARHLPLKAPGDDEPVTPASAVAVVAVIGLDCLGKQLGDDAAFRPGRVSTLTGLTLGGIIEPRHLAARAAHPDGCFKSTPGGAGRVLLLNKADAVDPSIAEEAAAAALETGGADLVALARLGAAESGRRIVAIYHTKTAR